MLTLDNLLDAPNLRLLLDKAEAALQTEAQQRQAFYDWVREDHKAEFINGEVILHSPVKERHWAAVGNIYNLLRTYALKHGLGRVASEKAMVSLTRNDYEPDVCFWGRAKADLFTPQLMRHPAPDLVVEVLSKSTAKVDREEKFEDYAAHGVGEYWIVDPVRQTIEQYLCDADTMTYSLAHKATVSGEITAVHLPGFRMPVRAAFDEQANYEALALLINPA